ncbi:hypothetical protein N7G274_009948 [Stereocaulon virgatum]|uniref:C2H2-type domain-containing protein n=1 Tax=Stereocaulon virgatum TaxID=373712 RepID=A0ABR3ZUK1_9LECA
MVQHICKTKAEANLIDPQGRDADQERKDREDAQKRRDRQEKERRDAEKKKPRNRVIKDLKGPWSGPHFSSQGKSKYESTKDTYLNCLYLGCEFRTKRLFDLERHMNGHYPPRQGELLDCPRHGCRRQGMYGFKRKDHLMQHLMEVHGKKTR